MVRVWLILGVAIVFFTIYALVDCALLDRSRIRGLARGWWLLVILFVPVIGGVLWFAIGRGRRAPQTARGGRSLAPDDDLDFLRRLNSDAATDERIRRLEQELAELDADPDAAPGESEAEQRRRRRGDGPEPGEGSGRPNG